jgi:hypothetical protein
MSRDNKISKNEQIKRNNKKLETDCKKKKNHDSDSDNGNGSDTEDEMDIHEFRKYVQKIFPSKYLEKKIKSGEKLKEIIDDINENDEFEHKSKQKNIKNKKSIEELDDNDIWETDTDNTDDIVNKKKSKTNKKPNKKNKHLEETDNDNVSVQDKEEDKSKNIKKKSNNKKNFKPNKNKNTYSDDDNISKDDNDFDDKQGKVNIIFTIGGVDDNDSEIEWDEYDEYDDDDEDYEDTEDEDESVSSVSSIESDYDEDYVDDKDEIVEEEEDDVIEVPKKNSKKYKKEPKNFKNKNIIKEDKNIIKEDKNFENEDKNEVLTKLKEIVQKNPKDKSIQKCIEVYEKETKYETKKKEKKEQKQKEKNMRIFRKILSDKNSMNDFSFYEKLDINYQKKLIKELREINKITRIEKPYRMTLLEADIPVQFKAAAFKKVNSLRYMESGTGEFYKIKNWVDTFMKIPFTNYKTLPVSIENGIDSCHDFMANSQKILNEAVYGLNDAKMQIMQMLGQLLTNPKAIGTAIAIHGPPGTGKTSLVKEGISKILNRPFAFIALGGATDSSFLEGHGYTYEGSTWGKIVQILIDSKCMNPVIYFDELDKISDTPRGEEIAGILTHLTDTSQNSEFHDKYFSEINFDLSKCLFIFSYNDETKVNSILKDRMYRIKTKGYSSKEKIAIANNYLLPKIREQVKFNADDIIISNDILNYINEHHCNKEDGVRNLKRCLEIIYTKLNLYRLMKPDTNLFEEELSFKVKFPFEVTKVVVDKLIKKETDGLDTWKNMFI